MRRYATIISTTGLVAVVLASTAVGEEAVPSRNLFLAAYDMNRNGVLEPAEVPDKVDGVFAKADLDGSGYLDAYEVLYAPGRLGRWARKQESVKLRWGELVQRGWNDPKPVTVTMPRVAVVAVPVTAGPTPVSPTVGTTGAMPATANPAWLPQGQPLPPPGPAAGQELASVRPQQPPVLAPAPRAPAANPAANPAPTPSAPTPESAQRPQPAAVPKPEFDKDGYPTPRTIIAHLDRNANGLLDRDEAVDKLSDNFDRLDKDRSNSLDENEIARGLKLAKLFGIKPDLDPRTYQQGGARPVSAN